MRFKILVMLILGLAFVPTLKAQDLTCLSVNDQRVIRQMLADLAFYKSTAEESKTQMAALEQSRDSWKKLYESEKFRADQIQGGRVTELLAEVKDLRSELGIAKKQLTDDAQKIGEQNAQIISLKSGRKWWFGTGAAVGGVAGYYFGKNQNRLIQSVTGTGFSAPFVAGPPPLQPLYNFGGKIPF